MKCFEIKYKPKDSYARVLLNQTIYGRIDYKTAKNNTKYAFYIPGVLDSTKFYKDEDGKFYLLSDNIINEIVELLKIFGEYEINEIEKDIDIEKFTTGEEYWLKKANDKQLPLRRRKRKRVKHF